MTINAQCLQTEFRKLYGREPRLFRAPGRVNLIGEHTDYNGGFVLPMAIDREAILAAALRPDRKICVRSMNLNEEGEIDLDAPEQKLRSLWLDYIEGVARLLERNGVKLTGADLLVWSDVPAGAGLSSSAALEISVGLALSEVSGQKIDKLTLALIGQQTEHEFVGAKVGIMDQFVSARARAGHALLLDCRSLEFENVPLDTKDVAVVICNTNVKHDLATSEYNIRRAECEQGVEIFKQFLPSITQLRDVRFREFEQYQEKLPAVIKRRCRHVVTENERTLAGGAALKRNDLKEFGRLMRLSHASLRDDYEVSCRELDVLVEIAESCEFVLGARMTGGGFGGSTVNLVNRENLDHFRRKISVEYQEQARREPTILISEASEGATEVFT